MGNYISIENSQTDLNKQEEKLDIYPIEDVFAEVVLFFVNFGFYEKLLVKSLIKVQMIQVEK